MSKTGTANEKPDSRTDTVCSVGKKSSGLTLAFSIDKIMSDDLKPGCSASARSSRGTQDAVKVWKTVNGIFGESDIPPIPETKVNSDRRRRIRPEAVSRADATARYDLQQRKMNADNMATGNGMAPEVGKLVRTTRHPEMLMRQFHHRHLYNLQSNFQYAERYHRNPTDMMTPFSVDPVTSSVGRCRLPVCADFSSASPNRGSEHDGEFTSDPLLSPTWSKIWRKRALHRQRDVTDLSQMAAGRRRSSPTGSPLSMISGCSAAHDEEEIVVDDDSADRKQFSATPELELPVHRPDTIIDNDQGSWSGKAERLDLDLKRAEGARLSSPAWFVIHNCITSLFLFICSSLFANTGGRKQKN